MEEEKYESPYCPVCDGCGEEGCCSPMMCKQSSEGHYCKTYLNDLKFGYKMYTKIYDLIPKDKETQEKLDEILDEVFNSIYKQNP